jgi:hypothetical protein
VEKLDWGVYCAGAIATTPSLSLTSTAGGAGVVAQLQIMVNVPTINDARQPHG